MLLFTTFIWIHFLHKHYSVFVVVSVFVVLGVESCQACLGQPGLRSFCLGFQRSWADRCVPSHPAFYWLRKGLDNFLPELGGYLPSNWDYKCELPHLFRDVLFCLWWLLKKPWIHETPSKVCRGEQHTKSRPGKCENVSSDHRHPRV